MVDHTTLTGTELHEVFQYVDSDDPGAVGAGKYWLDISGDPYVMKVRNPADDGWIEIGALGTAVNRSGSTVDNHLAMWDGANADSLKDGGVAPSSGTYPQQIDVDRFNPSATNGSWGYQSNASAVGYFYLIFHGDAVANSYLEWQVLLSAGTWKLEIMGITNTDEGIATLTLDGNSIGTLDWYGSLTFNVIKSITGIVIASTGIKTLRLTATTKNGSSSEYYISLQFICLTRTGA